MHNSPPLAFADIVVRLRAAGCVFAEDETRLLLEAAGSPTELADMVQRRVDGLPLEQILGWAEFCGLRIAIEPGVFVPRRRTECLVDEAVSIAYSGADHRPAPVGPTVVVDLCCGSGALGAAIADRLSSIELYAADIDPAAVRCARRNIPAAVGEVFEGDLYQPLPETLRGRIDLLVVNAPYVPTESIALMPPEARDHEPAVALDGGADGLDVLRRVIHGAPEWLAPGGSLLFESSAAQAPLIAGTVTDGGLLPRVLTFQDWGATVIVGTLPS
jgi:release factor glutamine methyltransferase